jgi:hypothetical protein
VFPSDTSESGDAVGFNGRSGGSIYVPTGYVSGSALSGTAFYAGTTLADFGLTLGETYTATWGTGPDADSFVITTVPPVAAVPEPGTFAVAGLAMPALGLLAWKKRKAAVAI